MKEAAIKKALISVSDKNRLIQLAKSLMEWGVELLSTGGSAKELVGAGIAATEVSSYTGFPEILGGRVKTLHPRIYGGLLGRRGQGSDVEEMEQNGISNIDLLVVNLYPFSNTVASGAGHESCIENIDIGGPAMIRAAAKNHKFVTVIVDPLDYETLLEEMENNDGATSLNFRKAMAAKAFQLTGAYDAAISGWYSKILGDSYPKTLLISGSLKQVMRYGENPHQTAAFYRNAEERYGVATSKQIQGKELSYNNLNDTNAAYELVSEFAQPACAIIKHANPCGVAIGNSLVEAYNQALLCDAESAYGGILAFNEALDPATAEEVVKLFVEVIIAPEVTPESRDILAKKKNLRVLTAGGLADKGEKGMDVRTLAGGYLIQERDNTIMGESESVVTKRNPNKQELKDLKFAFTICKHVKSNAIVFAKNGATIGIGAGQMSRVNSSRIATWKASDASKAAGEVESRTVGSVAASDAFFPFSDGLTHVIEVGATAVIQPGGSIRDKEVIATADEAGLAMVFTGIRHFKH